MFTNLNFLKLFKWLCMADWYPVFGATEVLKTLNL